MRSAPKLAEPSKFGGTKPAHRGQGRAPGVPLTPQSSTAFRQNLHPAKFGETFEGADLFIQLRQVVRLPIEDIAHRLGTTVDTLYALERGSTSALPPWPETIRIVTGYTAFAGIDPRPILSSIHGALSARYSAAQATASVTQHAGADEEPEDYFSRAYQAMAGFFDTVWPSEAVKSLKNARTIAVLSITLPLAIFISLASSGPVQAVASVLPEPVAVFFLKVDNFFRHSMAQRRDGHIWIEVVDPRSRKTDKLPSPQR